MVFGRRFSRFFARPRSAFGRLRVAVQAVQALGTRSETGKEGGTVGRTSLKRSRRLVPDLVGDRAGEFDGGSERELHDVDEVGLGEAEQRGAVDVVRAESLQGGGKGTD